MSSTLYLNLPAYPPPLAVRGGTPVFFNLRHALAHCEPGQWIFYLEDSEDSIMLQEVSYVHRGSDRRPLPFPELGFRELGFTPPAPFNPGEHIVVEPEPPCLDEATCLRYPQANLYLINLLEGLCDALDPRFELISRQDLYQFLEVNNYPTTACRYSHVVKILKALNLIEESSPPLWSLTSQAVEIVLNKRGVVTPPDCDEQVLGDLSSLEGEIGRWFRGIQSPPKASVSLRCWKKYRKLFGWYP